MDASTEPPFYILVSNTSLIDNVSTASSASLAHPVIHYHYADDSPLSLLPASPNEHVLVLDYDPTAGNPPTSKSISRKLAVTGLKVAEAPGAGADEESRRNDRMYILETTITRDEEVDTEASQGDNQSVEAVLNRFKQRNAILRRALQYPDVLDVAPRLTSSPGSIPISPSQLQS